MCKLIVLWNDPYRDKARKLKVQSELFLVGYMGELPIASVITGYDRLRGWINCLAIHPDFENMVTESNSLEF